MITEERVVVAELCLLFTDFVKNFLGRSPAVTNIPNAIDSPLRDQLSSTTFVNTFPDDLSPVQPASFHDEEEKI